MNAQAAKALILKVNTMNWEDVNDLAAELGLNQDKRDRYNRQVGKRNPAKLLNWYRMEVQSLIVALSYNED